jgi:hypothetical protein
LVNPATTQGKKEAERRGGRAGRVKYRASWTPASLVLGPSTPGDGEAWEGMGSRYKWKLSYGSFQAGGGVALVVNPVATPHPRNGGKAGYRIGSWRRS